MILPFDPFGFFGDSVQLSATQVLLHHMPHCSDELLHLSLHRKLFVFTSWPAVELGTQNFYFGNLKLATACVISVAVAQWVERVVHQSEGQWFDPRLLWSTCRSFLWAGYWTPNCSQWLHLWCKCVCMSSWWAGLLFVEKPRCCECVKAELCYRSILSSWKSKRYINIIHHHFTVVLFLLAF